ncbi:uncharacterized protein DUF2523 [Pseudomonas sp. SJZ080]|uniref:DUF2523 family protein n=1 Tax=Pseudomonas sp. SJZ080 TaxID=2572888 RepID=UPI00119BC3BC|nr:DUF2523 family protein [Pseudomonas sp. SJZ080]TWC55725.1 uncharacterized protein DUF2523 [Pseudomonas sp. SJZ080]
MWAVLIPALTAVASWLLPKLLAVAGTVVISATVLTPIFTYLQNQIMQRLNGMSADAVHFFQFVGIFDAVSVIFAAYTMAIGMKVAKAAYQRAGSKGDA